MVVVGGIIGAGIFINPYIVAQRLDSPGLVLSAWVVGGLIAIAGALTFAELGSLFPEAGGHYAYLRDAYHPLLGFLYGWALLLMIEGGAIAAVAIIFAEYTFRFLGRTGGSTAGLAILGIVIVAVVNYLGVKPGSRVLNAFVILKVAAIGVLIVVCQAWHWPVYPIMFVTMAALVLGLWGARQRLGDANPAYHALVTRPDVRAASWIDENLSSDARFLVNSCFTHGGTSVIGADGGWWLPLLAGRQITVPPQVYVGEVEPGSDYWQEVQELARRMLDQDLDDASLLSLLRKQGVTHVYLGQKQGGVACPGDKAIDPGQLDESDAFEQIYRQNRVWIFALRP